MFKFDDYTLSTEDLNNGYQYCMENKNFDSHVTTYIIANRNLNQDAFIKEVKNILMSNKSFMHYIYIGFSDQLDVEECEQRYNENSDAFGDYLMDSSIVSQLQFIFMSREDGIIEEIIEKE